MRMLKSLNHSLDMLELFISEKKRSYTLAEVTEACGLTKAATHTSLANLVQREYLHYDSVKRQYSLGLRTWELGAGLLDSLDLRSVALPVLTELTQVAGETALLSRYTNGSIVYVECIIGPAPVATYTRLGARAPAFCTATGKAQLAFTPPSELDRICAAGLKPHTDYTITDPSVLRAELHEVRDRGYSVNKGEYGVDVVGVGAPLFNRDGQLVGGMGLSGPAYRLGRQPQAALSEPLMKAAATLQSALARSSVPGVSFENLDGKDAV